MTASTTEHIRTLDGHLLVAADRLSTYRAEGRELSTLVQRGVIDRLLDDRLRLMAERDGTPT